MYCTSFLIRLIAVIMFYHLFTVDCESTKQHKMSKGVNGEWSRWSPCSRPCSSGITQRTRTCHPKRPKCRHLQTKICNTEACTDSGPSQLQVQCSKFDGLIMAGSTYKWVPFYTGNEDCSLQCRALGYKFYARLAPKLDDGTPCGLTKPAKHVCVDGQCLEVGCDDLVGSGAKDDSCGVCGGNNSTCRLVSGFFTSPALNPGYNFVAQIPVNATHIRVSHLDRLSANRIALRTVDGRFILSGINVSSSIVDIGSSMTYQNALSSTGETVIVRGPITQPIDLMVIYREPNKGIKYEYRIPVASIYKDDRHYSPYEKSSPQALQHTKAVHTKINASKERPLLFARYGEPTYAVGRGDHPQIVNEDPTRNKIKVKRKKFMWKISGFSECSKTCGGGFQTPIIVCVRERNEVVVPDKRCSHYKSPAVREEKCNTTPCPANWVLGPWNSCSVTCGKGIEMRDISCKQEISSSQVVSVPFNSCKHPLPIVKRLCFQRQCSSGYPQWSVSPWSQCSVMCGIGVKSRTVHCRSGNCSMSERPALSKECDMGPCSETGSGGSWLSSEWTNKCSEECLKGIQTRRVVCSGSDCDFSKKPAVNRSCSTDMKCEAQWFSGPWQKCTGSCGVGERRRAVLCIIQTAHTYNIVDNDQCALIDKPKNTESCPLVDCLPEWFMGDWTECPKTCDSKYRRREVVCLNGQLQTSEDCIETHKPKSYNSCNPDWCMQNEDNCIDEIDNCPAVVQARLCHYNYYKKFCCRSCRREN